LRCAPPRGWIRDAPRRRGPGTAGWRGRSRCGAASGLLALRFRRGVSDGRLERAISTHSTASGGRLTGTAGGRDPGARRGQIPRGISEQWVTCRRREGREGRLPRLLHEQDRGPAAVDPGQDLGGGLNQARGHSPGRVIGQHHADGPTQREIYDPQFRVVVSIVLAASAWRRRPGWGSRPSWACGTSARAWSCRSSTRSARSSCRYRPSRGTSSTPRPCCPGSREGGACIA
jgi:hypothetical protein